jgi:putative endonuclease
MNKNKNSFYKGKLFENIACKYLISKGYKIISKNLYSRFGEIDILATKDKKLIIIEVKGGKFRYQNINKNKLNKIINTFLHKENKISNNMNSFDAIQIDLIFIDEKNNIEHIQNIIE